MKSKFPLVAVIVSEFNWDITGKLLEGCLERFSEKEIPKENILVLKVPGAVEIPITAQKLAKQKKYEAVIGLGAVIRGDTDHYQFVCDQVSFGCQKVALENELPVIFGVLTTDSEEQALDRVGGKEGHKGKDAADAALQMIELFRSF